MAKKCRVCKELMPANSKPLATACSIECAIVAANKKATAAKKAKQRIDRTATALRIASLKSLPQLKAALQKSFNSYVRCRDVGRPCISCGKQFNAGEKFDAGHYRSVGSAPHMRYVEQNCHAQCVLCNKYKAGNVVNYRLGLIERIGLEAVEKLEADNSTRKYTKEQLIEMDAFYKNKRKSLFAGVEDGHT